MRENQIYWHVIRIIFTNKQYANELNKRNLLIRNIITITCVICNFKSEQLYKLTTKLM